MKAFRAFSGIPFIPTSYLQLSTDAVTAASAQTQPPLDSSDRLTGQEQRVSEQKEGSMARRRFQKGQLLLRRAVDEQGREDKARSVWVGRWYEDEIDNGQLRRVRRSKVLGTRKELTEKLALRELQTWLDAVNSPAYRARPTATFAQFAARWESTVLTQHKPSTQATVRSHLRKYLVPFFGSFAMRDIQPELVQRFLSSLKVSPKTVRNICVTLQMMWHTGRAWR